MEDLPTRRRCLQCGGPVFKLRHIFCCGQCAIDYPATKAAAIAMLAARSAADAEAEAVAKMFDQK